MVQRAWRAHRTRTIVRRGAAARRVQVAPVAPPTHAPHRLAPVNHSHLHWLAPSTRLHLHHLRGPVTAHRLTVAA